MITFPATPGPVTSDLRIIHAGGVIDSTLGGGSQIVNRPGARCQLPVQLPPMQGDTARRWFAALTAALFEGGRMTLRQVGLVVGAPGAPLVNGAGQVGQTLAIDGGAGGYAYKAGQCVSITTGGRKYLYPLAQDGALNGAGAGSILLALPLRASPSDNDPVEIAAPVIEGSVELDDPHLPFTEARLAQGMGFTISELR
jgi:hypothetical protein